MSSFDPQRHDHSQAEHHEKAPLNKMGISLALLLVVMLAEVMGGYLSGSLALLADAGHMLTDAMAMGLSLFALWISVKPAKGYAYGYKRAEVMAALVNGVLLIVLAVGIFHEAYQRSSHPYQIQGGLMMAVAGLGLLVNLGIMGLLHSHSHDHLGVRSAFFHVIGDTLGSLGAIVAGLVIWMGGGTWVDLLVSGFVGFLIVIGAMRILWDSTKLILGAVPLGIEMEEVRSCLLEVREVQGICDLHLWALNSSENLLTAHLVIREGGYRRDLLPRLILLLKERFKLDHITLQLEEGPLEDCGATCGADCGG